MIRALLVIAGASLAGCSIVGHVQVLPIVNPDLTDVSCCVVYAEIPPSTRLSLSVEKSNTSVKVKAGVKWRY